MSYTPFKMKGSPMKRNFPNDISTIPGDSPNKWSWGGVLKGAVSGAAVGGPWGAVAGGLIGGITGKKKTVEEKIEAKEDEKVEEVVDEKVAKATEAGGAYNTKDRTNAMQPS